MNFHAILFDLDGTLLDTAADLAHAMNNLLAKNNKPQIPVPQLKPLISQGSSLMIEECFGITPAHSDFEKLRDEFFSLYHDTLTKFTLPYPGIENIIAYLDQQQTPWGIVTNKPIRMAQPLVHAFNFAQRCGCVIGGDTLAKAKPHPEPLWHACDLLQVSAEKCLYIGDAPRDIEAGKNAGMKTAFASYGYVPASLNCTTLGADYHLDDAIDLMKYLK